jgi:hypothetical protein
MPALVINEIRFNYDSNKSSEFIELHTKTAGNLGAMRLFMASTSLDEPIYEFPPVEVAAGEYIMLHLRTLGVDKAVDELGSELNLSKANRADDSKDDARDLWVPGSTKYLHKTDVIYLLDQDDMILDGLAVMETSTAWGKNKDFSKAAELLAKQGEWLSAGGEPVKTPGVADTISSANTTTTQTLCRDETAEDSNTLADWYVCAQSNASPGAINSTVHYGSKSKSAKKL